MTQRLLLLPLACAAAHLAAGCGDAVSSVRSLGNAAALVPPGVERRIIGGDPAKGRQLLREHGCVACHAIPGERSAGGHAGPPLAGFARRTNIAGHLPNQPEPLVRFLIDAPALVPGTGMPNLALREDEARHIAA
jgi:mono/diheme cytochrome c family protein